MPDLNGMEATRPIKSAHPEIRILAPGVRTVQTHRSHIMEKPGLHNRTQLVSYAARVGLVRPRSR